MMGKIAKPGKGFKGCVEYCVLKKDAVVLDADGVRMDNVTHTITDFNRQRKMNPGLGQAVGHIALNWSPEDKPKLSDELMVSVAKAYLQKMKIQDTQVLIVRHYDRPHDHLHIVYNRVDNEGKTIPDAFQKRNNVRVSKALTLAHGFHLGKGKTKVNRQQLKGADQVKYELYDKIRTALAVVNRIAELQKHLAKQGIGMQYKYKGGTHEVQGISFSKDGYKFKGSEIDRSLSYGNMSKVFAGKVQAQQEQRQKEKQAQPKSLADQLREAMKQTYLKPEPETHYLRQEPETHYLRSEPQTNYLGSLLDFRVDISDDVDDEAIHGPTRRRKQKARTNTR